MEGAARHAQRLAGNFLEDMEAIQKASRERDRRAMSHFETNSVENSMPRVIHTSYSRNFPLHTSRLGSVPPSAVGTYRSTITSTDYGLPPVVHRNYRTNRYIYETPYYTTTYSNIEPIRTTYTSVGPRRYTYYYPSIVTTRPLSSSGSYSNLSSDMQAERRRIEYLFHTRMPELNGYRSHGPSLNTSELETNLYYTSPKTTMGYGKGLVYPEGSQTSELRGRIKRLLCRSRRDPHYYRYLPTGVV